MHRIYLILWSPHQIPSGQMLNLEVFVCSGSIQVLLYSGDKERLGEGGRGRTEQRCPIRDCPGEVGGISEHPASPGFPTTPHPRAVYRQSVRRHGAGGFSFPFPLIYFPSAAFCLHPRITSLLVCPVPQYLSPIWGFRSRSLSSLL